MTSMPAAQVVAAFFGGLAWQAFYTFVWRPLEDTGRLRALARESARVAVADHAERCPAAQLLAKMEGRQ